MPCEQPAAVGNIAGIQPGQAFIRVIADRYAGIERVKVVAAVPAAQAGSGAVTGGGFKILVPLAVLHHSAAAVVDPALPHRMGGAVTSTNSQSISSMRASCNMRSKAGIKIPRCRICMR